MSERPRPNLLEGGTTIDDIRCSPPNGCAAATRENILLIGRSAQRQHFPFILSHVPFLGLTPCVDLGKFL